MNKHMHRSRAAYAVATIVVVALGLASRKFKHSLPNFIAEYAGDALWALMVFLLIGFVWRKWPTARVAALALAISFADEISQLYHAPWIDGIRDTTIGGLVLGWGFLWSDLACYTVGVALGAGCEMLICKTLTSRRRCNSSS